MILVLIFASQAEVILSNPLHIVLIAVPQINQDAVRLMKKLYGIDMEQTQYSKTFDKIPTPDMVISIKIVGNGQKLLTDSDKIFLSVCLNDVTLKMHRKSSDVT